MGVVVRRGRRGVRVFWNGQEEIVSVERRRDTYIFRLRNGREVKTDNKHLASIVERRLNERRRAR